ncbi:hypothetical protein J7K50_06030 [bacterium]|nr:hypothetical protein [bacterium]
MRIKVLIIAAVLFVEMQIAAFAIEPVNIIVDQPNAPLRITAYDASFKESSRYEREGIHHTVKLVNDSERTIVAVEIGLVSFSIWNEFIDRCFGISLDQIEPEGVDKGTWVATALSDFTFLTGVAYVNRVRFENGEIWEADIKNVLSVLTAIQEGVEAEDILPGSALKSDTEE